MDQTAQEAGWINKLNHFMWCDLAVQNIIIISCGPNVTKVSF